MLYAAAIIPFGAFGRKPRVRLEVDPEGLGVKDTEHLRPTVLQLKKRCWQHINSIQAALEVVGTEEQLLLAP